MYNYDSKEDPDRFYEKIKKNKFLQQQLPAFRFVVNMGTTMGINISFGIILIIVGAILFYYSKKTKEILIQYESKCLIIGEKCKVLFQLNEVFPKPIIIAYELSDYYQNLRYYVKSKSDKQLAGQDLSLSDLSKSGDCFPVMTNKEMEKAISVDGTHLDPNAVSIPCGLIAKSYFNDTYELLSIDEKEKSNRNVFINQTDIIWESEKRLKHENIKPIKQSTDADYWKSVQWIDMSNEHFIVWMRPSPSSDIRKLWGRINIDLPPGKYEFTIDNNYDVSMYKGKKTIVITSINAFGGNNTFLSLSYLVLGSLSIINAFIFLIGYKVNSKNKQN